MTSYTNRLTVRATALVTGALIAVSGVGLLAAGASAGPIDPPPPVGPIDPQQPFAPPTRLGAPKLVNAVRIGEPDSAGRQRVRVVWRDNSAGETSFRLAIRMGPNAFSYFPSSQLSPQGSMPSHSIATKGEDYRQVILRVPDGRHCFSVVATNGQQSRRSADSCISPLGEVE